MPVRFEGRSALVTGASSGLGKAFTRALAARGMDIFLTALPGEEDRLSDVAAELVERHHVRAEIGAVDLSEPGAARRLQAMADEAMFEPDLLVNSAGFGAAGTFGEADLDRHLLQIRVNCEALAELTGLYLPRMVARRHGAVVNVASTAGLTAMPHMAVYGASKAFVVRFSEALWAENHRHGVRVVAVCPGPFESPFHAETEAVPANAITRRTREKYLDIEAVVAAGLDALDRDRPRVVLRIKGATGAAALSHMAWATSPRPSLMLTERMMRWWCEHL